MIRYRLRLAYDGTDFWGWQKQPQHKNTVQGLLETCLRKIYQRPIALVGSGRTDRGVHALNQWAHFDLKTEESPEDLAYKLQRMTPESLLIKSLEQAPRDFHAQISAISKTYLYRLSLRPHTNPFERHYAWPLKRKPSLQWLQEASQQLLGRHDFSSFQSRGTPVKSPFREISLCQWRCKHPHLWVLEITGNGFLKQMVRNIVGTMITLEASGAQPSQFLEILQACDRQFAKAPAPPQGLFLKRVEYPRLLDNKCRKL